MKDRAIQLTNGYTDTNDIDLNIEVIRNDEGLITQGLVVGDVMEQNQALILSAYPGEFQFSPTIGVGLGDLMMDDDYLRFRHRIRDHFAKDGLKVTTVELSKSQPLKIEAVYE